MSTLKVNTIRHTGASSDAVTLASDGTCTAKITNNLSNRNLIINGAMQVAQRGTSSTTMGVSTVDRWRYGWSGQDEAQTLAQVALTSSDTGPWAKGFRHCLQMTNGNQSSGAGTTDQSYIEQRIEAQDIATSGWDYTSSSSYLTLSFWVKSSVAQTFYFQIEMWDGTSQLYVGSYALSANTWTKITKQIPGNSNVQVDNNTDKGMSVTFWQYYGTNNTDNSRALNWAAFGNPYTPDQTSTWWTTNDATFALTGVQLEVGDTATEFEHRSYGDELQRCKRYYQLLATGTSQVVAMGYIEQGATDVNAARQLVPAMRATPTIDDQTSGGTRYRVNSGGDSNTGNAMGINSSYSSENLVWMQLGGLSGVTAGQGAQIRKQTSSARLGVSAEY